MDNIKLSKYYLNLENQNFNKDDILKLNQLLSYHSDLYYNKETPIISDYEYDLLFKKLQILEKKFNFKETQTQKVGSDIISSTFAKITHSRPMISLDNTYNQQDLKDFDLRVKKNLKVDIDKELKYTLEYKFDWLWVELIYENWKIIQSITRWNWIQWEDITQNILTISNIPKNISYKKRLELRWEIVMPITSFEELNNNLLKNNQKPFSNPRNAASWSVRLKDANITKTRKLKFFAYDIWNFDEFILVENQVNKTYFETIKNLEKLWFEISDFFIICKNIDEVIKKINDFQDKKQNIDFETDWLVIKIDDINLWQTIGFTSHHPRYAIAYKFPAQILTTNIIWVENQVWRTWTITPVANLEPININWVTIKRATLHNYDEIQKLWLKIWDNVFIKRAWEVIPKIISVAYSKKWWQKIISPENCPSCWNKLQKDKNKVRIYCSNHNLCSAQIIEKLKNSIWKWWLNIDWFWKEQVELFYKLWFITDLSSIFELKNKKDKLLNLPWYKEKSVNNLIKSIQKSKTVEISNFLVSLNIYWVWKIAAKELSKFIKSNDDLINFNYSIQDLESINDIWELTAKTIFEYFNDEKNKFKIEKLLKYIKLNFKQKIIWWKYSSKKICITWSFDWYSRDQLIDILEKNWWTFVSSISSKTDFLLAWEKAWSKLKKATEFWIKIIDLQEFLKI